MTNFTEQTGGNGDTAFRFERDDNWLSFSAAQGKINAEEAARLLDALGG